MRTRHTPGPWVAKPTASRGPQYKVYPEKDGPDIAIIYDHYNTEANARLIAAAPEMLSALQDAAEHLNDMGCEHEGLEDGTTCVVCTVNRAIARATEASDDP